MKTKTFTLVQLFSLVDGRLSTHIDDVYEMLDHITGDNLMIHQLPVAMKFIKEVLKPQWFSDVKEEIDNAVKIIGTNNFLPLITYLKEHNTSYEIKCVKDVNEPQHFEKVFGEYMVENSFLKKI